MPELPEVETIRRQLGEVLPLQKIVAVEVKNSKSFYGAAKEIVGRKITKVKRRAKILMIQLDNLWLLVHLKMTGQLMYQVTKLSSYQDIKDKKFHDHRPHFEVGGRIVGGHPTADWVARLPNSHTRVIIQTEKGVLYFNDQRIFGWMKLVIGDQIENEFKNYGPDITDQAVGGDYFWKLVQKSRRAIKLVIMDQKDVAGVGNIYANDALWCAKISPMRKAQSLMRPESDRLLVCLKEVIDEGIKYGGATASDDKFVQTSGLGGKYQEHFKTYERTGQLCLRGDGGKIRKTIVGGRGTYYCERCQS